MSETTEKTEITLPFMTETDIARLSVSALSNRPSERSGQYGRKGLTPEELKEAFSKLPVAIAARMNELLPVLRQKFSETDANFSGVCDVINEVIHALDLKLDKLQRPSAASPNVTYVYGEDAGGKTALIKGNSGAEPSSLVYRDSKGSFSVSNPTAPAQPVTKQYFDNKSNNSLYADLNEMERRVHTLEHSANGNIYSTVNLHGSATAFQVDNACPYGILSRLGGNVAKITVGLPFDTQGTKAYGGNAITENITPNSVSMPIGETANVRIPCRIKSPCTVTVYADEGDAKLLNKCVLLKENAAQIGSQVAFENGRSVLEFSDADATVGFICITKQNQGTALTEPFRINNIRVILSDPTAAELLYVADEIEIPAAIRGLSGYGAEGAYLDLIGRKFYGANGAAVDISAYMTEELEVLSLIPSAILGFSDEAGKTVSAEYELSYKNKL